MSAPSFLSRIADASTRYADVPVPISLLLDWATEMSRGGEAAPLAPGVLDARNALMDEPEGRWVEARAVVADVAAGKLTDWGALEGRLRGLRVAPALRAFLDHLTPEDVPPLVAVAFWEMARLSAHEEPVKWGILLGSIHPAPVQIPELLLFARHPEFTRYAVPALRVLAEQSPGVIDELVALLPRTSGYATVHVARGLLGESEVPTDPRVARDLVVHGMMRGIKAEIAVPFALRLDAPPLAHAALEDEALFEAMVMWVNALAYDSGAFPERQRERAVERLYAPYLNLLAERAPDIRVLSALVTLGELLGEAGGLPELSDRPARLAAIERILRERADPVVLDRSVHDPSTRSLALHVIEALGATQLSHRLASLFEREPDVHLADVLSRLGGPEELDLLRRLLPRLVDVGARSRATRRHESPPSAADGTHRLYAVIVRGMGRLGTPEAVEVLKQACRDEHPWGRAAACEGFSLLPRACVDEEIRALIRERLHDTPEYVAEEARNAARAAGMIP